MPSFREKTIQKIDRKDFQGNSSFSALASCINSRYTGNVCNPAAAQSPRFKHSNGVVYTGQWRFRTTDVTIFFFWQNCRDLGLIIFHKKITEGIFLMPPPQSTCPWPCICFRGSLQGPQHFVTDYSSNNLWLGMMKLLGCKAYVHMFISWIFMSWNLDLWWFSCLSLGLFILNLKCLYIPWMFLFFLQFCLYLRFVCLWSFVSLFDVHFLEFGTS